MKVLTVRQPWAWLLFHGKPVENRDWWTAYRGPLGISASKGMTRAEYEDAVEFVAHFDCALAGRIPHRDSLVRGALLGTVEQVGCVTRHTSPFFQGPYGHVYINPQEFAVPIQVKGMLGMWDYYPDAKPEVGPPRLF